VDSGAGLTEDVEDGGVETGDGLLQEEDRGGEEKVQVSVQSFQKMN
jgi:hypothetical protein